jgi:hypothetical protein
MHDQNDSNSNAWRGLYARKDNHIVEAKPEDAVLAKAYSKWPNKGPVIDGRRITIMATKQVYRLNEELRIIHVLEATLPGYEVYLMGPKAIIGEYVNGQLQGKEASGNQTDPFRPEEYDGRVLNSPAIDYNFDITAYSFPQPGLYTISWQTGKWKSNTLEIEVLE